MQTTAVMGLMTSKQAFYTYKMSKNSILHNPSLDHESSDFSCGSGNDGEHNQKIQAMRQRHSDKVAQNLFYSQNKVDIRMMRLHQITRQQNERKSVDLVDYLGVKQKLYNNLFK